MDSHRFRLAGLTYSPLAAQILSSLILAEPPPISAELFKFIHPARFWVRAIFEFAAFYRLNSR